MLGGGDKGAAGCLVLTEVANNVRKTVDTAYPLSYPNLIDKYAVHTCKMVEGITVYNNVF
jgi:hypothetical protein